MLAAIAILRKAREDETGEPLASALIEQAAMAYLFVSPAQLEAGVVGASRDVFSLIVATGWLKGSEPVEEKKPRRSPPAALSAQARARGDGIRRRRARGGVCLCLRDGDGQGPGRAGARARRTGAIARPSLRPPKRRRPTTAAATAKEQTQSYTAKAGDTLRSIARKLYGKPEKWRALAEANPGVKPNAKLKAGQAIRLPPAPAPQKSEP